MKAKYAVSTVCLVVGASLLTYAHTRLRVSRDLSRIAEARTRQFVEEQHLASPECLARMVDSSDECHAALQLLGVMGGLDGGAGYIMNKVQPYYLYGALLVAAGVFALFVGKARTDDSGDGRPPPEKVKNSGR